MLVKYNLFITQLLHYNQLDVECQVFFEKRRLSVAVENQDTKVSQTKKIAWYQFGVDMSTTGGKRDGKGKAGGISNCPKSHPGSRY